MYLSFLRGRQRHAREYIHNRDPLLYCKANPTSLISLAKPLTYQHKHNRGPHSFVDSIHTPKIIHWLRAPRLNESLYLWWGPQNKLTSQADACWGKKKIKKGELAAGPIRWKLWYQGHMYSGAWLWGPPWLMQKKSKPNSPPPNPKVSRSCHFGATWGCLSGSTCFLPKYFYFYF